MSTMIAVDRGTIRSDGPHHREAFRAVKAERARMRGDSIGDRPLPPAGWEWMNRAPRAGFVCGLESVDLGLVEGRRKDLLRAVRSAEEIERDKAEAEAALRRIAEGTGPEAALARDVLERPAR